MLIQRFSGRDSSVGKALGSGGGSPWFKPQQRLSGLRVRPFQVSGGEPPPPEQTPCNRIKTCREDSLSQTTKHRTLYLYNASPDSPELLVVRS